jgi:hypothetical protein
MNGIEATQIPANEMPEAWQQGVMYVHEINYQRRVSVFAPLNNCSCFFTA